MNQQLDIEEQNTLKDKVLGLPVDTVIFRSDYPEYHAEFVGSVLAELTKQGVLMRVAQGIYVKPDMTRFGPLTPSIEKIVKAIAHRDNAQVMPCGVVALNALGLSTQVPMTYTYLTTGTKRTIKLKKTTVTLRTAAPRYFAFETELIAWLVQALKALKEENVEEEHLQQIRKIVKMEPNKEALKRDVLKMPAWMKKILKPMMDRI